MGSQIKSPTSCISQTQEDKDGVVSSDKEEVILEVIEVRDGPDLKVDLEVEEVDSPAEEDSREESLTKVLPPKDPKYLANARIFSLVSAVSGPFTSRLAVCISFSWFSRSEVCAFVWGMVVRGVRVETFVRVLRSSRCRLLNNWK